MYSETTNEITVSVLPQYLREQSDPSDNIYVWAYTVQVENGSTKRITLLNRHWMITDEKGQIEEVHGEGVIGEQPSLDPEQGFRYTSGTHLSTPSGIMTGSYEMIDDDGQRFKVKIPAFSLDSPFATGKIN